jgi:hypothetical protein
LWRPFRKWRSVDIFRCRELIQVIIIYLHMKCRWNWTMLNLCGIVATILKMATARNLKKKYDYWRKKILTETSLFDRNWVTSLKPRRRSRPLRLVWWALMDGFE